MSDMAGVPITEVPAPVLGGDPQGQVDIDRFFQDHAAQLDGHDYADVEPAPGLVVMAQKLGIPLDQLRQRTPVPWTKARRDEHQARGQLVRRYVESQGWGAIAEDTARMAGHVEHLQGDYERIIGLLEQLPTLDRDGDLGDVGEWEFQPYAEQLDTVLAEYRRWLGQAKDAADDIDTVSAWLEQVGDLAGYGRARQMFENQPAAARRIADILTGSNELEFQPVTRDAVKLPDKDKLEQARARLLKFVNARQRARLLLKQLHDARTEGQPIPKAFEATFRRSGRSVRSA